MLNIEIVVIYYDGYMEEIRTRNHTVRKFHSYESANSYIRRHRLEHMEDVSSVVEITSGFTQGGNNYEH